MTLSVVIPTHNPHRGRLARTLEGLRHQTLSAEHWELVLADNASTPPLEPRDIADALPSATRIVREEALGLTAARLCGFRAARGDLVVLVDDDNVLAPDYLERARAYFSTHPHLGAAGGKSLPEFEAPPAPWVREFFGLLALRDLGDESQLAAWNDGAPRDYPRCSPIGAGLVIRRSFALAYAAATERDPVRRALDRTGSALVSGGDNDLVMTVLEAGAAVGYFPDLRLTHLIAQSRVQKHHLGALNRAIARSWVRVLDLHGIRPWPAVPAVSVPLRQARAWWRAQAWRGPAEWIRWQGHCGQFEGQAGLPREARSE